MANAGAWRNGVYETIECDDPDVFYTLLGKHFRKRNVVATINAFTDLTLVVKYPLDMLRATAQSPLYCLMIITIENGTTWSFKNEGSNLSKFYRPISELRNRSDCSCMFRYPEPISMSTIVIFDQF